MTSRRSQLWLRCVTGVAIAALVALASAASGAATKSPTDFLKDTRAKLDKILAETPAPGSKEEVARDNKFRDLVKRLFDYKELGIRTLDKHWAKLTPAEQDEFLKTLSRLIENNYIFGLKSTGAAYTMKYTGEEIVGTQASVKTEITATPPKKKKPMTIAVEYRLLKDSKGEWRVYDISTDGDSLVDLYKAEFNKVIAKDGFPVLMKKLKSKADSGPSATAGTPAGSTAKP